MIITVDTDKLKDLVLNADKIFMSAEGDQTLVDLITIEKMVEEAKEQAQKTLEESALKLDPNFKSIQSDKVKVFYKAFGARFYLDETRIAEVPVSLYTQETKYKVDPKAVEGWIDEHKGLPVGINEVERVKKLTFSLRKGGQDE
jgi:macrodomain Ter protein organizer (MatP/YcbG family)